GLVDVDLHDESVALIAKGFATLLYAKGESRKVVVGRDCRTSSTRFRDVFTEALAGCGVDVVDVGVVPTPLVYYGAQVLEGIGGLAMITGSHNPPEYNGFKIGVGKTTMHGEQIQDLLRIIQRGDFPTGAGTVTQEDLLPRYREDV